MFATSAPYAQLVATESQSGQVVYRSQSQKPEEIVAMLFVLSKIDHSGLNFISEPSSEDPKLVKEFNPFPKTFRRNQKGKSSANRAPTDGETSWANTLIESVRKDMNQKSAEGVSTTVLDDGDLVKIDFTTDGASEAKSEAATPAGWGSYCIVS